MLDWNEYSIADVVSLVIDYRGKTPKKLGGDWSPNGYRALSAKNIKTGEIVQEGTIRYISEDIYHKWMKEEIQREDILITSEAPFGQIFYWDSDEKIVLSQRLFAIRVNEKFYPKYIYFYMTTSKFQAELEGRTTGTTVVGLRQPELMKCKIIAPSYEEQKKIADILWSIEKKVNINEKINQNLEKQMQAIFTDWYNTASNGADTVTLESVCQKITDGSHFSPQNDLSSTIPMLSVKDMHKYDFDLTSCKHISEDDYQIMVSNDCVPQIDDILVAKDGSYLKEIFICNEQRKQAVLSSIAIFRPNRAIIYPEILLAFLKSPKVLQEVRDNYVSGSALPRIVLKDFKKLNLNLPSLKQQESIIDILKYFRYLIAANIAENLKLINLRDTLLPKLMSGELDVSSINI